MALTPAQNYTMSVLCNPGRNTNPVRAGVYQPLLVSFHQSAWNFLSKCTLSFLPGR